MLIFTFWVVFAAYHLLLSVFFVLFTVICLGRLLNAAEVPFTRCHCALTRGNMTTKRLGTQPSRELPIRNEVPVHVAVYLIIWKGNYIFYDFQEFKINIFRYEKWTGTEFDFYNYIYCSRSLIFLAVASFYPKKCYFDRSTIEVCTAICGCSFSLRGAPSRCSIPKNNRVIVIYWLRHSILFILVACSNRHYLIFSYLDIIFGFYYGKNSGDF